MYCECRLNYRGVVVFTYIFGLVLDILWIILYLIGIFYLGAAILSLLPSKFKKISDGYLNFAIVIPAHNEEKVIKNLLYSLIDQEYPKKNYKIYVMADNCIDKTVSISSEMGASVIFRSVKDRTGKGSALADAFEQIKNIDTTVDAFVIIDADNVVGKKFLREICITMLQGNSAVQGYIDAKNPMDSWVSHAHSVWYWITNHIIQKGLSDLGTGCLLGGTGFAISKELVEEISWDVNSLAEDAEYTAKLCLNNKKVHYAPGAVVYDEKPCKFKDSVNQRLRWAKGVFFVKKKYSGLLLKKGKLLDLLKLSSNWLMPLTFFTLSFLTVIVFMNIVGIIECDFVQLWVEPFNVLSLCFYTLGMIFSTFAALVQDKKYSHKILLNSIGFWIYIISWIPIGIYGAIKHRKKEWYHTKHSQNK